MTRLTLGELFCGAGGMSLGAHGAGFSVQWGIDNSRHAIATYNHNHGCGILQDVRKVDFAAMPAVDVLAFGFPCNDFSVVGRCEGVGGKYGGLYRECIRAVSELKPDCFVAENVLGIKKYLPKIMDDFGKLEYDLYVKKLEALNYGVAQTRRRYFIVGQRRDLQLPPYRFPAGSHADTSAGTALQGLTGKEANQERRSVGELSLERLSYIKAGDNGMRSNLPDHLWPKRMIRMRERGLGLFACWYRRIHPDRPSFAILASGGAPELLWHYDEPRPLTNRELARLHSYPDCYEFKGGVENVKSQIGMSVPPRMAQAVFKNLLQ